MRIGLAFDLKTALPLPIGAPDDLFEEFDSPATIQTLVDVLQGLGHSVTLLGDGREFLEKILADAPDMVFNFAEGTGVSRSREARVPAVCEMLGIPYTGSDPLALAVALDKDLTRRLAEQAGLIVPKGVVLKLAAEYHGDFAEFPAIITENEMALPLIAKPTLEGSSKGMRERCLIQSVEQFGPTVTRLARDYQQPVLVEEFIDGDEITVGLVGNEPPQVVGVLKIFPQVPERHFVYTLEKKRDSDKYVDYECPVKYPEPLRRKIEQAALTIFQTLGCRDVARVDFRVRNGVPFFLEINPLPGLNPATSDLPIMARMVNVPHSTLMHMIIQAACNRVGLS